MTFSFPLVLFVDLLEWRPHLTVSRLPPAWPSSSLFLALLPLPSLGCWCSLGLHSPCPFPLTLWVIFHTCNLTLWFWDHHFLLSPLARRRDLNQSSYLSNWHSDTQRISENKYCERKHFISLKLTCVLIGEMILSPNFRKKLEIISFYFIISFFSCSFKFSSFTPHVSFISYWFEYVLLTKTNA
jgi:hypothetical protein